MINTRLSLQEALSLPFSAADSPRISLSRPNSPAYLRGYWDFLPDGRDHWSPIKVPSFWSTPEQFDHPENWREVHTAFYHRSFRFSEVLGSDQVFICFGAVSMVCDVYLNGTYLGSHGGKFTPFRMDATQVLREGENSLCLVVGDMTYAFTEDGQGLKYQVGLMPLGDHMPDPFMPDHQFFGGIWQAVYLERIPRIRAEKIQVITSVREKTVTLAFDLTGPASVTPFLTETDGTPLKDVTFEPLKSESPGRCSITAHWENPRLWTIGRPNLYLAHLQVRSTQGDTDFSRRFGFREFRVEGNRFLLNEIPVRLFGESLNMSQQMLCAAHRKDYMKLLYTGLLRDANLNCVRLHSMIAPHAMIEAADEVGMLIVDQSGLWSSAGRYYNRNFQELLQNQQQEFSEWIWRDINSPSVIIWDVENELLRGSHAARWVLELDRLVRAIDTTRPIEHSGSGGLEKLTDFYHLHHNEQYAYVLDQWEREPDKPLVIGEWWIGGRAGTPRNITGMDHRRTADFTEQQATLYYARIAELRLRGIAGIIPYNFLSNLFEPLFDYRRRITLPETEEMEPCPDFLSAYSEQPGMGKALCNPDWDPLLPPYRMNRDLQQAFFNGFAPVAAFFRDRSGYIAQEAQTRQLLCVNDSQEPQRFTLTWTCRDGDALTEHSRELTLQPGQDRTLEVRFPVPGSDRDRTLHLSVSLFQEGRLLMEDRLTLLAMAENRPSLKTILLYDTLGETESALRKAGISFRRAVPDSLPGDKNQVLLIGKGCDGTELTRNCSRLADFVQAGGRILVLQQRAPASWYPLPITLQSCELQTSVDFMDIGHPAYTNRGVNFSRHFPVYAQGHPLFAGIPATVSNFQAGDGRVVDDVYVKPAALGSTCLTGLQVLSGGSRQNQASALEYPTEKGTWLFLQYQLTENLDRDPMARRLLFNALAYLQSPRACRPTRKAAVLDGELSRKFASRLSLDTETVHTPGSDTPVLLLDQAWTSELEALLEPWIASGGTAVVLPRQEGALAVFGNQFRICENALLANGLYVRPSPLTWGLYGTDLEAECIPHIMDDIPDPRFPVYHALLSENAPYASRRIFGDPWEPLIELVYRHQTCWWYQMPAQGCGDAAVQIHHGRGSVILWQLDPLAEGAFGLHFLEGLLQNLRVTLPSLPQRRESLRIFRAREIPMTMDPEAWISDMDDTNLIRNPHAQPMILTAGMTKQGSPRDNEDISGVVYIMYDDDRLYLMAMVIDNAVLPGKDGLRLIWNETAIGLSPAPDGSVLSDHPDVAGRWQTIDEISFRRNRDIKAVASGIASPYFSGYCLECSIPSPVTEKNSVRLELWDQDPDSRIPTCLTWPGPFEPAADVTLDPR